MNIFGFCRQYKDGLDLETFLKTNTIGLVRLNNIEISQVEVSVDPSSKQSTISTKSQGKLLEICYGKMEVIDHCTPFIGQVPVPLLWGMIAGALRTWVIRHEGIPSVELVPGSELREFGYETAYQSVLNAYAHSSWDARRMRAELDSAFVSVYVEHLMRVSCRTIAEQIDPKKIVNVIFDLRRDNLRQIVTPIDSK